MSDFTLEARHTLVVGMTGSGKTTFVNRYLLNTAPACRFIFDDLHRMAARLHLRPVHTEKELFAALAGRWVCYWPDQMFRLDNFTPERGVPTPAHKAFRWFCNAAYQLAHRGPGAKIVCLPEMWRWCSADAIPLEFALLAQAGRELGVELMLDTQRPENLNPAISGQMTELVCFRLASREALRAVKDLGADPDLVKDLPLGSFISWNRLSGATLAGRVF